MKLCLRGCIPVYRNSYLTSEILKLIMLVMIINFYYLYEKEGGITSSSILNYK